MDTIPDETPGGMHQPRDVLSRAAKKADQAIRLLESDSWPRSEGAHSGLRSYAIGISRLILHLVEESQSADAEAFDTILSSVDVSAVELTRVMSELLEL
jgi:hypothetical protein